MLIQRNEDKRLEFKQRLPANEQICKLICAFANTAGGFLIVGIEDATRAVVGVPDGQILKMIEQLNQTLFDSISPVPAFEIYQTIVNQKNLIVVEVFLGNQSPYYLKSKGKEKGTFVRVGSTVRLADAEAIQDLERKKLNISFDEEVSFQNKVIDLDLKSISDKYKDSVGKILKKNDFINLGYIKTVGSKQYPTYGGLIICGKSSTTHFQVHCARFKGQSTEIIVDQKEFGGNLIDQIENAMIFIKNHIPLAGEIKNLQRKDSYKIPLVALREALVNATVHRDYTMKNSNIKVAIFDQSVVITSPGSLIKSMTIENMIVGRSEVRNKVIARTLKELNYIEQWGTGMLKIISSCKDSELKPPEFIEAGNYFQVKIFSEKIKTLNNLELTEQEMQVIELFEELKTIKNVNVQKKVNVSASRAREILHNLVEKHKIIFRGDGKARIYKLL